MNFEIRLARFKSKLRTNKKGCWIWTGPKNQGYGYIKIDGRFSLTHRVLYEYFYGKIQKGLVIDHLCRNRACANLDHLEIVTDRENILRGEGMGAKNARKTHCKYGHIFSKENTYTMPGTKFRYCRKCMARRTKEWEARCKK